jgi:hypothetical protein
MLIVNTSILGFGYYKKSLGPSFQAFMNTTLIINSFFFVSALFLVGTSDLKFPFAAISYIVFFYSLLINKSTLIKKLSGIPLILLSWEIIPLLNFNSHLNVLVVSIYLFVLSLFSSYEKKDGQAKFFEISAFILEFSALCFSSLIWETEIGRIIFGIVLIALSIITIIYSLNSNKKYLLVISSIFLALELFIRLLFVIVVIPWWVYLLLVGLGLIAFSIYSIRKER